MGNALSAEKSCGRRCLIISSVITIGGGVTAPVADSARNSLKTRTSLRAVSTLRGQDQNTEASRLIRSAIRKFCTIGRLKNSALRKQQKQRVTVARRSAGYRHFVKPLELVNNERCSSINIIGFSMYFLTSCFK